jgi:hypothetical protein
MGDPGGRVDRFRCPQYNPVARTNCWQLTVGAINGLKVVLRCRRPNEFGFLFDRRPRKCVLFKYILRAMTCYVSPGQDVYV